MPHAGVNRARRRDAAGEICSIPADVEQNNTQA
jgi:hypothetical protein